MICLVFPYSGIILNLSHIHIGYILHKDFCLYPSFLLVPMHTRLYAQLTWIHPGCLEACLCPTIYPWRMILGICQCITQKNSLKFLPYPSISPSFKQLLKKKKQKKLISLIPSFYPTSPQLPSVPCCFLPATTFIVFMTPMSSLQGITPARQRLVWMSFSLLKQPPGILVNKLSISFHKEAHHKKVLHPRLSTT